MIYIAHRGNVNGPDPDHENTLDHIENAMNYCGFDVEVDIWKIKDKFFLGHDKPQHEIDIDFLEYRKFHLWLHTKNVEAFACLKDDYRCFMHDKDPLTVVSFDNFVWGFPVEDIRIPDMIFVCPDSKILYDNCDGICSDYVSDIRESVGL